jgi:hypothetical protein
MTDTTNTGVVQERSGVVLSPSTVEAMRRLGLIGS